MDRPNSKPVLAAIALGLFIAFGFMRCRRDDPHPEDRNGGSEVGVRTETLELVRLANRSMGHLENGDVDEASKGFQTLTESLPSETLGFQNLAVSKVFGFQDGRTPRNEVDTALARLSEVAGDSAATHWLISRVAIKAMELETDQAAAQRELSAAIDALERARSLDPDNVVYHFGKFEAAKLNDNFAQEGAEALQAAYELEPTNLFLLAEWLFVLVERKDPEIVQALTAAREAIAPARRAILQKNRRYDVFKFTDQALAAAAESNWTLVKRFVQIAYFNLLRPEDITKSDERRLHPHILEFSTEQFSSELLKQLGSEASPDAERLAVRFESKPSVAASDRDYIHIRLVDVDLDERLDLLALADDRLDVFSEGAATTWERAFSTDLPAGSVGLLAADLDHDRSRADADGEIDAFDADADVVVYGREGITVLQNDLDPASGERSFVVVQQAELESIKDVRSGVLVDFDHDSDLDLVLATSSGVRALLAESSLTFTDVTEFSQMPPGELACSSLVAVDWDRDVDIDVVVAGDGVRAGYLENLRHGNFRWVPFPDAMSQVHGAKSLAVLDVDGNAAWDLCGVGDEGLTLTETSYVPSGGVRPAQSRVIDPQSSKALLVWDFDNDSLLDVLAWGPSGLQIRAQNADGTYESADEILDRPLGPARHCDVGDIDGDGDLDLAILSEAGLALFTNEGGNKNQWLQVRALGRVDNKGKVNHHGLGSLLELRSGVRYQAQTVERPVTHLGLGADTQADLLRFLWTNGISQAVIAPESNQAICEPMELKGSCPYLYAWDGEKFSFVTDLLWAAPIGLQLAEGKLAPTRPWENLLVRGDQLRERDGRYELRITEELWEAAYFDEVQLIAVDHPASVEVYTNEKVGPEDIALHKIHTVSQRRYPRAARDKQRRDVLDTIMDRDGEFFQGFETRLLPGLVDEHYLELDLGDLQNAETVRLFLSGWIYPTDTSLNVAISQDARQSAPRPPSIRVPDAGGEWQEVVPFMGYPGGKTKTIAVDLTGLFLTDDYRLRIMTTAEIYWDEVFFTVDDPEAATHVVALELESAEVHYRGFSAAYAKRPRSPEVYDYSRVTLSQKWPPMRGHFTRYGDVAELLTATDDRLVVLASGDEIALSFIAPADPPRPGWKRDFVLHSVGWDKDADLNTVYGQSVEPLPYVGMTAYPYHEKGPDSKEQRDYLQEYQTRRSAPGSYWRQLLPARDRAGMFDLN